jgi:hypothetical protein
MKQPHKNEIFDKVLDIYSKITKTIEEEENEDTEADVLTEANKALKKDLVELLDLTNPERELSDKELDKISQDLRLRYAEEYNLDYDKIVSFYNCECVIKNDNKIDKAIILLKALYPLKGINLESEWRFITANPNGYNGEDSVIIYNVDDFFINK